MPLSCDLTPFQILGQKSSNFFFGILVQTMTPKGHFEINWPLVIEAIIKNVKVKNKSPKGYDVLQPDMIPCQCDVDNFDNSSASWFSKFKNNFNDNIVANFLKTSYGTTGSLVDIWLIINFDTKSSNMGL